ncbi:uncharacterized protein PFL1_06470 [Pseudozyma flocculosa PF-1]|uniref:Pre-mRNA-splicing factor SYF1 n=1 Tax=Pseudozyma flocculosa PF-1 TaxID=1277687 RepID=A0A061H0V6_9BASI|nr:uncharacterized protein PFL1_06470 [Pseudozyma flocculosa PF-1]EPQ26017.1 hypothetical protein PFL1_06470 [Pseudozyma flocculosa PF-1]
MPSRVATAGNGERQAADGPFEQIAALFPLTVPFPDPSANLDIVPASDIALEQELLRNPDNLRSWASYINHIVDTNVQKRATPDSNLSSAQIALLGPLASASQRLALQRITSIYERALAQFPTRYSLWTDYLQLRSRFVLGEPKGGFEAKRKRDLRASKEGVDFGPTLLEANEHQDYGPAYTAGLDGIAGWIEWRSLAACYERALMWLPKMPRVWLEYLSIFLHPQCPPILSHTHARRTFDRALRTLPGSLHLRIWKVYLRWAERVGGETCLRVWRRYLRVDPSLIERYVAILLAQTEDEAAEAEDADDDDGEAGQGATTKGPGAKALEAAKLLLRLARSAADGSYTSPDGKSPYQLLVEWLELTEKYPEEIGISPEEEKEAEAARASSSSATASDSQLALTKPGQAAKGRASRGAARPAPAPLSPETNPMDRSRLNVGAIVRNDGLAKYPDQAGRLWTGLATYWIKRGELETAKETFEEGIRSVVTVRDFTQIFDAYAETSENVISFMMEDLAGDAGQDDDEGDDDEGEGESREDKEAELDQRMKDFEELMERRPFLVNDVLLRRNPDDVQEWEKRVALHGDDDEQVIETYRRAIDTVNPRKATANYHQLFLNFARFYEEGGSAGRADPASVEADLASARKIFERAITVPFKKVDDLAEVWCEWAEMEVRHSNYDEAIRVMARSVATPRNTKNVAYHDDSLPPQVRLFKSLKLWSFYVDLEESLGDVESAKRVYDRMLELKIANAQIIINYAAFLEDHQYYEESFKVYERGVEVFTYPVAFELWNVYLSKFVKRYGGSKLERARDLFEQALDKCPPKYCKPILLMYGKLEEEHGLAKRAMNIYDRATRMVSTDDRFDMYAFYIAKAAANFGLAATRPIYERAIESLPDRQTADMCLRFANLERKLGEIDRARAIYAHASQFCDPRTQTEFWKEWNKFEIETGSEDTFREMLRIKRSVQAQFNTDVSYIAASAMSAAQRNKLGAASADGAAAASPMAADPMARLEAQNQAAAANGTAVRQPAFVAASSVSAPKTVDGEQQQQQASPPAPERNEEKVGGDDADDDDLL